MKALDEGKELSRDVSYHLNESAGRGFSDVESGRDKTLGVDGFTAIDYKHKAKIDKIESIFSKSKTQNEKSGWQNNGHEDNSPSGTKHAGLLTDFDYYFYLSYLLGFVFSVFGIAILFSFCKKELYHRAGIYGATASVFFINIGGLYFLTNLVWDLNAGLSYSLPASKPSGLTPMTHPVTPSHSIPPNAIV